MTDYSELERKMMAHYGATFTPEGHYLTNPMPFDTRSVLRGFNGGTVTGRTPSQPETQSLSGFKGAVILMD